MMFASRQRPWKADLFLVGLLVTSCASLAYKRKSRDNFPEYTCPTDCKCATIPEKPSFAVQMVCLQPGLTNLSAFKAIPSRYTSVVTLICSHCMRDNWIADDAFSHLTELEKLKMVGFHFISKIPKDAFRGLHKLKVLAISIHGSGTVCDPIVFESANTFVYTPQLENLDLFFDSIIQFPKGLLCPLQNLRFLNMSLNCMRNITDLGMSENNCSKSLQVLDLTKNLLMHFPPDIHLIFPNLQEIYLGFNSDIVIPETAFAHLNIHILDLEFLGLHHIPSQLLKGQSSLVRLKLGGNNLTSLSRETFRNLSKLEDLDLHDNQLSSDTLEHGVLGWLSELRSLDLSRNKITIIKDNMFAYSRKLLSLNLSKNNLIQILDSSYKNLAQLQVLDLSRNRLTGIRNKTLQGLCSLQKLDLSENMVTIFEDSALNDSRNTLRSLNLSHNRLKEFPEEIGVLTSLQFLDMVRNAITSLPNNRNINSATSLLAMRISRNRITRISRFFFGNKPLLIALNLGYNNIDTIEEGVFDEMPQLRTLILRENRIKSLSRLFSHNPLLARVDAAYNSLTRVDATCLPFNIFEADFSYNVIKDADFSPSVNFPLLRRIDFQYNRLDHIDLSVVVVSGKTAMTEFFLSGNPFNCTCRMAWIKDINGQRGSRGLLSNSYGIVRDLHTILCWRVVTYSGVTLASTLVEDLSQSKFLCKFETFCWKTLLPTCDQEKRCPSNCSCYHTFNKAILYVNCDGLGLGKIPDEDLSWATNVSLANNDFSELTVETFKSFNGGCPEYLYLQNNTIKDIAPNTFRKLACVQVLRLDRNQISHLGAYAFVGLHELKELHLQDNMISSIDNRTFHQLVHLEKLQLHDNRLVSLPEPNSLLPSASMKYITLSGNPWTCRCVFAKKFRQWLILHVDIIPDLVDVKCTLQQTESVLQKIKNLTEFMSGSKDNRTKLIDMEVVSSLNPKTNLTYQNPSSEVIEIIDSVVKVRLFSFNIENYCYLLENLTVVHGAIKIRTTGYSIQQKNALISTIVIFSCLFAMFTVIYANRMTIRIWIFTRYGWRPFYYKKEDFGKTYDAYISYSDMQLNYVIHELLPKLEQDLPGLQLHVRTRDQLPGGVRANDIIGAIENSRRTIVLLSDDYLADMWCLFEFQRAHYNALHTKTHSIIVVLLHTVKADGIDNDIRCYLKSRSYFRRDDKKLWQKVRYALPDTRRRTEAELSAGTAH